jgi:hypothetical protein
MFKRRRLIYGDTVLQSGKLDGTGRQLPAAALRTIGLRKHSHDLVGGAYEGMKSG